MKKIIALLFSLLLCSTIACANDSPTAILYDALMNGEKIIDTKGTDVWNEAQILEQLSALRQAGCVWRDETTAHILKDCSAVGGQIEIRKVLLLLFEETLGQYFYWDNERLAEFDDILLRYGLQARRSYAHTEASQITKEAARLAAVEYLVARPDLAAQGINEAILESCAMDYKLLDENEGHLQWIVGFTLQAPIARWRGFAVRVSAETGEIQRFTFRAVIDED